MRNAKTYVALGLAGVLLAASASSADARWYHHGRGGYYGHGGYRGGPGLVGGVVVGALTLATLPFAIVGAAVSPPHSGPPPGYYGGGYGPPPAPPYYGNYGPPPPPPDYYRNYGPPRGYYGDGY
jgi:hypothetical protein